MTGSFVSFPKTNFKQIELLVLIIFLIQGIWILKTAISQHHNPEENFPSLISNVSVNKNTYNAKNLDLNALKEVYFNTNPLSNVAFRSSNFLGPTENFLIKPYNHSFKPYKIPKKFIPKYVKKPKQSPYSALGKKKIYSLEKDTFIKKSYGPPPTQPKEITPRLHNQFHKRYVITASVAPTWAKGGESQTFYLLPDIQKTYENQQSNSSFSNWELFFGYENRLPISSLSFPILGQIGFAVATSTPMHLQGDIWEDADPDFNNYYYRYNIQHTHVALKTKITPQVYLNPYISASVGVGFNNASNFVITPKIYQEIPAPPFQNGSKTSLTYTFGIGVQQFIGSHYQISFGYEFENWGQSQLQRAEGQTLNSGLSVSHLFTHGLQFSLSYLT